MINGFDLEACRAARRRLADWHGLDVIINDTAESVVPMVSPKPDKRRAKR